VQKCTQRRVKPYKVEGETWKLEMSFANNRKTFSITIQCKSHKINYKFPAQWDHRLSREIRKTIFKLLWIGRYLSFFIICFTGTQVQLHYDYGAWRLNVVQIFHFKNFVMRYHRKNCVTKTNFSLIIYYSKARRCLMRVKLSERWIIKILPYMLAVKQKAFLSVSIAISKSFAWFIWKYENF